MNVTIFEYFVKGGIMMYPLFLCSILSLTVIINKIILFVSIRDNNIKFAHSIVKLAGEKKFDDAIVVSKTKNTPLGDFLSAGLEAVPKGRESVEEAFEEQSLVVLNQLEKYLPILSVVAGVATLTGFSGTVIGMIRAFNAIAANGVSSPTIVATGIAEALITTATGLMIAIPTLVGFHYFNYRVNNYITFMEMTSIDFIKGVFYKK
ncbi:MAG: MotA/TolQ/ExbB proton channel family protein [Elusimicrobiota bacterium]